MGKKDGMGNFGNIEKTKNEKKLALAKWTNSQPLLTRRGISGSTLKILAIICMIIDHIGAGIFERYEVMLYLTRESNPTWHDEYDMFEFLDTIFRGIGRLAFPIFIFLLIEGFKKTEDIWKYLLRIAVFAVISEVPFDLCFYSKTCDWQKQNVFFTLLMGLFMLMILDYIKTRAMEDGYYLFLAVLLPFAFGWVAEMLNVDYGALGILSILVVYLASVNNLLELVAGAISFVWETTAPLGFIPMLFYNGRRGLKLKYIFYIVYPLHLLIIAGIAYKLGIFPYIVELLGN